jgi:hypothetical protein
VGLAATTVKGYDIFEDEFRELVSALERETNPPDAPRRGSLVPQGAPT